MNERNLSNKKKKKVYYTKKSFSSSHRMPAVRMEVSAVFFTVDNVIYGVVKWQRDEDIYSFDFDGKAWAWVSRQF